MKTINWDSRLSLGIDSLDKEHAEIFAIIKHYQEATRQNDKDIPILELFENLQHYARYHFAREEAILRKTAYPDITSHTESHRLFAAELNRFQHLYSKLPSLFPHDAMLAFLNEWLVSHISNEDNAYKEHLEKHSDIVTDFFNNTKELEDLKISGKIQQLQPQLRILDDEFGIGELISNVANNLGFDTRSYQRANQFYADYHESIDVIILDLHMPDIDGIEVIRDLAQKKCQAALILISGFDGSVLHSAEELAIEQELNLAGSLTKPFRINELHVLLTSLIDKNLPQKVTRSSYDKTFSKEDIRQALSLNQFEAYYQPQLSLGDQALVGVEVLCRWNHPEHGTIAPVNFIPIAERFNIIDDLTWIILSEAVVQTKLWQEQGIDMQLSINMPASMFTTLDLPERMHRLMADHQLPPSRLVIEVTESIIMDEQVAALDSLTRLRLKGFQISIDDFGTGYSSMLQLHRIPFSEIKVDQSFVLKMQKDPEAQAIAETVIMLGHKLGLTVVAEGIEDAETLSQLKSLNCEVGQGFHFAKPMSAADFYTWVRQDNKDNLPRFHLLSA